MLTVTITIKAKDLSGVENSINEAKKHILTGNVSGMDSNDDEEYDFTVEGEEEVSREDDGTFSKIENGKMIYFENNK